MVFHGDVRWSLYRSQGQIDAAGETRSHEKRIIRNEKVRGSNPLSSTEMSYSG